MEYFLQGFLLQASLILALGAQNLFVIDTGLRREKQWLVASICTVCDMILVLMGVLGAASLFLKVPFLKVAFGFVGVVFLALYSLMKIREGFVGGENPSATATASLPRTTRQIVMMTLGFTLLNPHMYLDTLILIGGYSSRFSLLSQRFWFGLGAGAFSAVWFFSLSGLSSAGHRLMQNPQAMRTLALVSGAILLLLSWNLGQEVWVWFKELYLS